MKKEPCSTATDRLGTLALEASSPAGDETVIVDLRTVWCWKAAQPSVARRDDHLTAWLIVRP